MLVVLPVLQLKFRPRTIVLLRRFPYVIREWLLQWVARLTRNVEVVRSSPIKGPRCFLEQETLP